MSVFSPDLTQPQEKTLGQIVKILKEESAGSDTQEIVAETQIVSIHLLAQQIAYFSVRQPTAGQRERYLKSTVQRLSLLIRHYEKVIHKAPPEKKGVPAYERLDKQEL